MHELGIVFHVIKSVEEIAQENELTKVSTVTLSIGEVSGIVPSYLTDCWRWAADRTEVLSGSELNIEMCIRDRIMGQQYQSGKFVQYRKCGSNR